MDWPLFFSTFSLVFIAELPDKTALATLFMATRGQPVRVFVGVALAFLVQTLVAVAFGGLIGLLPAQWVHVGAGLLFLGFAWYTLRLSVGGRSAQAVTAAAESHHASFFKEASRAFMVIFVAEWGDLTQLATASLAAHYRHASDTIFVAAVGALWCVSALAIFVGNRLTAVLEGQWLHYVGSVIFAGVGIYFLVLAVFPGLIGR